MTTKDIEIVETFEVFISNTPETGLDEPSKLKLNYPRTIDKERLKEHLGTANKEIMEKVKIAWEIALDWNQQ
jgi:mRNA-degrading endonuclease toxin of MazEF toxin-antitoxin module